MKTSKLFKICLFGIACLLPILSHAQSNILVFGDSLSAGYGIPRDSAWPVLLQAELNHTHPHYKVINASISGETTSGALRRLPAALKQHRPSIVIIELGANDGLRGTQLNIIKKNLADLIRLSKNSKAKVLLVGMKLPPNYGIDYANKFSELFLKLAQQHNLTFLPFMLEGLKPEDFQADNLHPVSEAQPIINKLIMTKLNNLL